MENLIFSKIQQAFLRANSVLLVSDERVDGDSLGSSLALALWLKREGKNIVVFVPNGLPEQYSSLPGIDLCIYDIELLKKQDFDLMAICDCSDNIYAQKVLNKCSTKPILINIDHHNTNSGYGDLIMVDPEAPATCELVFRFLNRTAVHIDEKMALCLMVGLSFDTTFFKNSATNTKAFEAASKLAQSGIRFTDIINILHAHRSAEVLRLWGIALKRLVRHSKLDCVTTFLTQEDFIKANLSEDVIEGLSDFLGLSLNSSMMAVLRETSKGAIKVSMRTKYGNVVRIATAFGGGGHTKAAGFTIPNARIKQQENGKFSIVLNK